MAYGAGEMMRRLAGQLSGEGESRADAGSHSARGVPVALCCKSCGKKFKIQLYPSVESDERTVEEMALELDVKCPKCKSSDVEILVVQPRKV